MAKEWTKAQFKAHNEWLQIRINQLEKENQELRKSNQLKIDTSMMAERRLALASLSQMVDAVSHAIRFTVGKEVM